MAVLSINPSPNLIGAQISQFQADIDARSPVANTQRAESGVVAQFSVFGQFQASLSDLQSKAQSLKSLSVPPTFQDLQLAVHGFVDSLNSLRENARQLAARQEALASEKRDADSVLKAVDENDGNMRSALQQAGISQDADGTFSVNERQLGTFIQHDRSGALSNAFGVADHFAQFADRQTALPQLQSAQTASTAGYAASKAIASYAAVAAL